MDNDDLDALAAEYVLGTLPSDERAHAEALVVIDPGFVDIVRQWERRLGELNVMVEAVEPPAALWDKVKASIATLPPSDQIGLAPAGAMPTDAAKTETDPTGKGQPSALLGALAGLASPGAEAAGSQVEPKTPAELEVKPAAGSTSQPPSAVLSSSLPSPLTPPGIGRSAEVFYLARRVRRWRRVAAGSGALAAVLAALIVASQVEPGLIPAGRFHVPRLFAPSAPGSAVMAVAPGSRLVAVLQQEPSSPAFLLMIDPASRTLTVRTVAAREQAGHSYQLWLIAPHSPKPVSLGLVGGGEYIQRPLPAGIDVDTARVATFAVSYEPTGGSKSGTPSGPILFTGKLVGSVPPVVPAPKT
jgi:anti-sigma-K factor RskA